MPVVSTLRQTTQIGSHKNLKVSASDIPSWISKKDLIGLLKAVQKATNGFVGFNVDDDKNVTLWGPGAGFVKGQLNHIQDNTSAVMEVDDINQGVLKTLLWKMQHYVPSGAYFFASVQQANAQLNWDVKFISWGMDPISLFKRLMKTYMVKSSYPVVSYITSQTEIDWTLVPNGPKYILAVPNGANQAQDDAAFRHLKKELGNQLRMTFLDQTSDGWNLKEVLHFCKQQTVEGVSYRIKSYTKDDGVEETSCVLMGVPEQVRLFRDALLAEFQDADEEDNQSETSEDSEASQ